MSHAAASRAVLLRAAGAGATGRRFAGTARSMGFEPVVVTPRRDARAAALYPGASAVVVDAGALPGVARDAVRITAGAAATRDEARAPGDDPGARASD